MAADIIFLYISKFGGHARAAESIDKEIQRKYPSIKTKTFDASFFYPVLAPIISKLYLEIVTKIPEMWNYVYDNKKVKNATAEIRNLFNLLNFTKLNKFLEDYKPKIIVCTHAVPANVIAYWKQRNGHKIRTVSVITDYAIHSYWANPQTDLYLIPHESLLKNLSEYGIPTSKIHISGIPIDISFSKKYDRKYASTFFGLNPNQFTILLMGGNEGIGPYPEIISRIISMQRKIQLFIITGNNRFLYQKLRKSFSKIRGVHLFKYIKNISCAMDSANVLITKPGGLTITEAMSKCLPVIIVDPIQGQESKNASFLERHRLVIKTNDLDDIPKLIKSFITNKSLLEIFYSRFKNFIKINAASICAEQILKLF